LDERLDQALIRHLLKKSPSHKPDYSELPSLPADQTIRDISEAQPWLVAAAKAKYAIQDDCSAKNFTSLFHTTTYLPNVTSSNRLSVFLSNILSLAWQ
jgi:hypothetical protein